MISNRTNFYLVPCVKPAMAYPLRYWGYRWAEQYANGRFTGRLCAEPTYMQNGDVAPGWCYVGNMTAAEFDAAFIWGEHDQCHTPDRPDWRCPHCDDAGWNEPRPTPEPDPDWTSPDMEPPATTARRALDAIGRTE